MSNNDLKELNRLLVLAATQNLIHIKLSGEVLDGGKCSEIEVDNAVLVIGDKSHTKCRTNLNEKIGKRVNGLIKPSFVQLKV